MSTFQLAYGHGAVPIEVPAERLDGVLEPKPTPSVPLRQAFDAAWSDPIGMDDPAAIFRPGDRVLVLVNDHTRPTPTRELLGSLWEKISDLVATDRVTVLVATGTHRAPTEDELESGAPFAS